jgi:hypothetical protein
MKFVVIVDQSEPPGSLNGLNGFGPYSEMTAEAISGDINGEAMAGEISINSIAVVPLNEGAGFNLNSIVNLLKKAS